MTSDEKVLILGALFHDIGKFEQRCTGNPKKTFHQELGKELLVSGRFQHRFEAIVGKDYLNALLNVVSEHHNDKAIDLTKFVREADHISASERVKKEEVEYYKDQWSKKHLCSLFSKIQLLSDQKTDPRYYRHRPLSRSEYDILIPQLEKDALEESSFSYDESHWESFKCDLEAVLDFYQDDIDFDSLINMLLIVFEQYLWCVPDFTGSSETDISLYNHLKDVAGLSHAMYLTEQDNPGSNTLNLIIGDIPGIQEYIFNVAYQKPAKILRGRSIFVQILTRNFASLFLKELQLTEANLIMLAGGKFYILAPDIKSFNDRFTKAKETIENYLYQEFRMDLSCNCAFETFDYQALKQGKITFGELVEKATIQLHNDRYRAFENHLFGDRALPNFVREEEYISEDGEDSNSIKCKVTDRPIRKGREAFITEQGIRVDQQVKIEYEIGSKITGNNIIVVMEEDGLGILPENIYRIKDYKGNSRNKERTKLLLNPTFDTLRSKENKRKEIFRNFSYVEVANYCSPYQQDEDADKEIMPFNEIADNNTGANFLTLIKGDIDNLGLIMAHGLTKDTTGDRAEGKDLSAISRTTTLSNHLKYFFSFFLNGFLRDWELKARDNLTYTIFAGGDDLMFVTPQSSAVKLIEKLDRKFSEFTCHNNEVHSSYSITHFKDHTPIRIVAGMAEDDQKEGKKRTFQRKKINPSNENHETFVSKYDKSSTRIFETTVHNAQLSDFIRHSDQIVRWIEDPKIHLSHGLIRKLLDASDKIKKYEETGDVSNLIWHARLTYSINRLLKDKNGRYRDELVGKFFESVLKFNKDENEKQIEEMLYPLICQVIYNIR